MKTVSEERQNNRKHYIQAYRKGYNSKRDIDIQLLKDHIGNIVDIVDDLNNNDIDFYEKLENYLVNLIKNNGNEE